MTVVLTLCSRLTAIGASVAMDGAAAFGISVVTPMMKKKARS